MPSRRLLISATTGDALADQDIRVVPVLSVVNLWAVSVAVTDTIGLRQGNQIIMDDGTCNVSAAALGLVQIQEDQLVFNAIVQPGINLRVPCTVGTSLIFIISVEPV